MEGHQWGRGGRNGGKGTGNKQHKWQVENRQGEVKNSIGNVEAKELTCTTHGHELKGENVGGRGCPGQRGIKGGKWDNCNSIINKIYLKNKKIKKEKKKKSLSSFYLNLHGETLRIHI